MENINSCYKNNNRTFTVAYNFKVTCIYIAHSIVQNVNNEFFFSVHEICKTLYIKKAFFLSKVNASVFINTWVDLFICDLIIVYSKAVQHNNEASFCLLWYDNLFFRINNFYLSTGCSTFIGVLCDSYNYMKFIRIKIIFIFFYQFGFSFQEWTHLLSRYYYFIFLKISYVKTFHVENDNFKKYKIFFFLWFFAFQWKNVLCANPRS